MTEQHGEAIAELRLRVTGLVASVDAAALERPAPATPGWRARDVLAHIVGVSDDVVNGRLDGIASDEWTAAQVERWRGTSVDGLLDVWAEQGPRFETMLANSPEEIAGQAMYDAATHEHDLRHALDRPGARDSAAMARGWEWFVGTRTRGGAPAIRFVSERGEEIAGAGEPKVTVRAPYFELFRATTGRRTADEMASFAWEPAPEVSIILAAPFFTMRTESLGE